MSIIKVSHISPLKRRTVISVTLPFVLAYVALSAVPATLKAMKETAVSAFRNW